MDKKKNNPLTDFAECIKTYKIVLSKSLENTDRLLKEVHTMKKAFHCLKMSFGDKSVDLCHICYVNERNFVFVPCGHIFCKTCSNKMVRCAICKANITKNIKVFIH